VPLTTLELPFGYVEHGKSKSALVKVVLCGRCFKKLMWKRNKEKEKQDEVDDVAKVEEIEGDRDGEVDRRKGEGRRISDIENKVDKERDRERERGRPGKRKREHEGDIKTEEDIDQVDTRSWLHSGEGYCDTQAAREKEGTSGSRKRRRSRSRIRDNSPSYNDHRRSSSSRWSRV
jgi:protein FRA10AC1